MRAAEMEIAVAQESHVTGIVEVWKEFMDFHRDIDPHWTRAEDGHVHFDKRVRELMASEDALVLVALQAGQIVAYSLSEIRRNPPVMARETFGYISDMAVAANHQRRGAGGQMLTWIQEWFTSRDVDRIELGVASRNEVGYSFWRKLGFRDFMHDLYLEKG